MENVCFLPKDVGKERTVAKKKKYAPTEQELALPEEYMTLQPAPLKASGGMLLDRTATVTSNWTIFGSIVGFVLVLAPIFYSLITIMAFLINLIGVVFASIFSFGLIYLAGATFENMMPTLALFNGNYVDVIYGQIVPVTTVVVFVLSIVSAFLLFTRAKTSPVWRIVMSVLIFIVYLLILILYHSGVIVYG